ncbi:DNA cytosine methyltransferase, partial [Microcoleus anatoxicus]|uniref:DNA cytosine methyltransferase n=1 Tax=Microcoleus anatoxicus TaxID=2705319 RepID=UPI0030C9FB8D
MSTGMNQDETIVGTHIGKKPHIDRRSTAISCIDLFCGLGGLTHGLIRGGIKVVAGIDIDPQCRFPYESNN